MNAHTPGPWKAYCRDVSYQKGQKWPVDQFLQWEIEGPEVPPGRGEFYQADALLIAAAPELLAALIDLRDQVVKFAIEFGEADFYTGDALAAIKKATGEA